MSKAIAKIFTVTKNEYDLIEDFIIYHSYIFGYDNIVIIDNGSTHPDVIDVYNRYSSKGVQILNTSGYDGNKQGLHFTNAMRCYKDSCEFLIGLDTDCYFTLNTCCDKDIILNYLSSLPKSADIFRMNKFLLSVIDPSSSNYENYKLKRPTECTTFIKRTGYAGVPVVHHSFYRGPNFISTENGNHNGITTTNTSYMCDEIVYVHYHETGKGRTIERCREIMIGYGFITNELSRQEELSRMLNLRDGTGIHRQRQYIRFLQDPSNFLIEDIIPSDIVYFSGIKTRLEKQCNSV